MYVLSERDQLGTLATVVIPTVLPAPLALQRSYHFML